MKQEELNKKIVEWIDSNRNNKTRIVFEMQDKEDPNKTYSLTLGNLFDCALQMGEDKVIEKVEKLIDTYVYGDNPPHFSINEDNAEEFKDAISRNSVQEDLK